MKKKVKPPARVNDLLADARKALSDPWLHRRSVAATQIATRLVNARRMASAWKTLSRHAPRDYRASELLFGCIDVLDVWHLSRRRRPAKHRQHYRRLAAQARELLDVLAHDRNFWADAPSEIASPELEGGLRKIAEHAENIADHPLSRNPRRKGAAEAYLARSLSAYFSRTFGKPLDKAVAAIASVLFGREVTPGFVKNQRMRRKKRSQG